MAVAAVTGGSGTIGTALIGELLEHGWEVRALARSEPAAVALTSERPSVVVVPGDVQSTEALTELVNGADCLFNVAGINEMCVDDPSDMMAVNVDAPVAMLRLAASAGVGKMVHVSSAAAEGRRTSLYAESKWRGDVALRSAFLETDRSTSLSLVAPVSVQGPGRVAGTGKLILDVLNGRLPFMIDTVISIVDIADCAIALRRAADVETDLDRLVLSGFTMSTRQALEELQRMTGSTDQLRFVPARAVRAVAPISRFLSRFAGLTLCPDLIRTMTTAHIHDGARAAETLGLTYRSASETFERLIEWAQDEGLVAS